MGFLYYEEYELGTLIGEAQDSDRTDGRALNEIMRRFEPLAKKLGRELAYRQFYREDVEGAARLGLTNAVVRHQGVADTFPAYARVYMTGSARRERARWLTPSEWTLVELDELRSYSLTNFTPIEEFADYDGWGFGDIADAVASLRLDQQNLLDRRYRDQAGLAEIAAESGCSVSAVSQRLTTIHRRLTGALTA